MWEAIDVTTRSHTSIRHKGKEIAKLITPPSKIASKEDSNPEQAQRDKDMQNNLALIAKYFKKIYKPTNNNLRTSSNSKNKNMDTTPWYKNDDHSGQFGTQRTVNVAGPREKVASPVVQKSGIQCFNCKEYGHFAKERRKSKRYDWLADTDEEVDEQELEAHYSYMAKIQEVPTAESGTDSEPVEQVQNNVGYNVFTNVLQHSEQSKSVSNTCLVETDDRNVIPDSPDMCEDDIQNDQNDVESDDERVILPESISGAAAGDVNVQFLQQLQPEWSRFVTIVKQQHKLDEVSYHKLFDILKQYQNEINELRAEKLARNANPLALVATAQASQHQYYQTSRSHGSSAPSPKPLIPSRSHTSTRHKGKELAKPITPPSETASEEDSDPEQAQRDKDMQKNLALIAKYFKKIYKPTNNNLRTSSNYKNKNVDTTPREKVGSLVVQKSGIQCFNCKEYGHFAKEFRKPKRYDWLEDTDEEVDEQELEAHYSYMAKIQEVPTADSGTDSEPVELVQNDAGYNVFANKLQYSEQSESVSNTCLVEMDDSNVTPDLPDMCEDDIQNDQNDVESDDERVALANLIANLKLDVDENKKIQKQLKKANTTLAQKLKECKTILAETNLFRAPTALDMEILIQTCLMPLDIKTQGDSLKFVHELKQEMHADLKYVESLEKAIDELESKKAEFLDMYDVILHDCVSKDVMCSYLMSLSDLDTLDELQCLYLHKVKECDCLAQKLSNQTESVSKEVHNELLKCFAKVEKHSISLEIVLQKRKEQGKSMDTKFDRPSVVRKPNAQRIPKASVLDVPSQQKLDTLFGPFYDEFFNAGTNPSTTIPSTSAPSAHTNMHAKENNNDQAEEREHIPDDKFTNPFCALTQEVAESSSHNIDGHENGISQWSTKGGGLCCTTRWVFDPDHLEKVYRLRTALYGLKQAPRAWYDELSKFLTSKGFTKGLQIHQSPRGIFINQAKYTLEILHKHGMDKGIKIHQSPYGIFINQDKYAREILIKHGMTSCDSVGTPIGYETPRC
nr:hypothetical protein [Tanacetum cinerariifolium]